MVDDKKQQTKKTEAAQIRGWETIPSYFTRRVEFTRALLNDDRQLSPNSTGRLVHHDDATLIPQRTPTILALSVITLRFQLHHGPVIRVSLFSFEVARLLSPRTDNFDRNDFPFEDAE
ncbi:hypothetical protein EVAR_58008_1 [Eumeta japonica]|uniref:Uncharacterized protein n=1 Tax=Eumeta variegata TaxID=151549 RepID=A0A4C1YBI9_EUMVA|nr:hypothetical protein EVAR_58008_1 [Eumeta japonica]